MRNLKEQYTRFFGTLTEQTAHIDAIDWFDRRDVAERLAKRYKLRVDSLGYSGGKLTFGLIGKKKDLIKAFMDIEFAEGADLPGTGSLSKREVLKMYPELK